MKKYFLFFAFLFFMQTAYAGYDEGLTAYEKGDYATAFTEFTRLAELGDASSQYNLGQLYWEGKGVSQSYELGVVWYKRAAEQGNARAQYNLGVAFQDGNGVAKDLLEAKKWFQKSAEQGHIKAQLILGIMYDSGLSIPKDYTQAVYWYKKAAEQGNVVAQNNLGGMYAAGQGVSQNWVLSFALFECASTTNPNYVTAIKNREIAITHLTVEQIIKGKSLAQSLKQNFSAVLSQQ